MARKRSNRYNEVHSHPNFVEVRSTSKDLLNIEQRWDPALFENRGEIVLELGCGRGEYTRSLAERHPEKNFMGIDIKGDRLCLAARYARDAGLKNAIFVRIQAEHMPCFFPENIFSEIWITFPDPHAGSQSGKKRLTSERFLNIYRKMLSPSGKVHLKTDDDGLYHFSRESVLKNSATVIRETDDLYASNLQDPELKEIKTTYETRYLAESKKIKYLCFDFS